MSLGATSSELAGEARAKTQILFFGRLAEQIGRSRDVDLPQEGCTVAQLRARLAAPGDASAQLADRKAALVAIDQEIAGEDAQILPGQEIAFFSPLSGG